MFLSNLKQRSKILVAIVISLILTGFLNKEVFIAGTPKIIPNLDKVILAKIQNTQRNLANNIKSIFNGSIINQGLARSKSNSNAEALRKNLRFVSKGVYAAEDNNVIVTEINTGEVPMIQYTFIINGQTVTVGVPKDSGFTKEQVRQQVGGN